MSATISKRQAGIESAPARHVADHGFTTAKVTEQTAEIGLGESQLGEHAYDQLTEEDLVHFGH
jgi:hypothetical protein